MYKASNLLALLFIVLAALPSHVLGFACSTRSNVTLVNPPSDPQLGNANLLKNGGAFPWPKKGSHRIIKYCYANDEAQQALSCRLVIPAMTAWARALGYPAGPVTGHSLAWQSSVDTSTRRFPLPPLRCYGDHYKNHNDPGPWNPAVPPDTLAIHLTNEGGSSSTVGYIPEEWYNGPGRHNMYISPTSSLSTIIHEFGHILGMIHEQCRDDRDEYIVYRCEKLQGFDEALRLAMADGVEEAVARTKLCDELDFAVKYSFGGLAYIKNDAHPENPGYFDEGEFDVDSIMLYPTESYSSHECFRLGIDNECPIMKIDKVGGKATGTMSRIHFKNRPSAGDVAFVKKYYPWDGDAPPSPSPSSSPSPLPLPTKKIRRTVSVSEVQVDASTRWRITRTFEREEGVYVIREEDEHVVGEGQDRFARGETVQPVREEEDQAVREEQGQLGRKEGA